MLNKSIDIPIYLYIDFIANLELYSDISINYIWGKLALLRFIDIIDKFQSRFSLGTSHIYYIDDLLRFVLIFTCVNSRQARNTHRSDHWSAPLFMFLLPAENSCMHMRNKIKTNRDKSSIYTNSICKLKDKLGVQCFVFK